MTNAAGEERQAMAAYLVVEAEITDWEKFSAYARSVPSLVTRFGGEYLVLGGKAEALEGDWGGERLVVHRWPDMETARQFWNSAEYAEIRKLREGAGRFRVMLLEGHNAEALETGNPDQA